VTPQDYDYLRHFLKERSGLDLAADKQYLVESRLAPVARRAGLAGISELVDHVKARSDSLAADLVEAMTINETFFFRDKVPFEALGSAILPTLMGARRQRKALRIWCAAGSTGQESYSIAMCLKEMAAQLAGWRIDILATDLSQSVLEKAKSGIYTQFEVQRGLPIQMLMKYFTQIGDLWQINPEMRAMVQHRQLNLLDGFTHLGTFDIIFCRNVLIYFDPPTKSRLLGALAQAIEPDGVLVLGAAETVIGLSDSFRLWPDHRGLYRPSPRDALMAGSQARL
jgi:chemotaxis protein methyltransferase CheR